MPPPLGHAMANALRKPCSWSRVIAACGGFMIPDAGSIIEVDSDVRVMLSGWVGGGGRGVWFEAGIELGWGWVGWEGGKEVRLMNWFCWLGGMLGWFAGVGCM